jgi:hypothetical protein
MGAYHEANHLTQIKKIWVPEQHNTKPRLKNYLDNFNFETWNVWSLYLTGALTVVEAN